ncbi:MAG: hypothetical protein WC911_04040 [Thermoleophilia bacterium]
MRRIRIISASLFFALAAALVLTAALACSEESGDVPADEVAPAAAESAEAGEPPSGDTDAKAVLLFTISMHIEPLGSTPSPLAGNVTGGASSRTGADYNNGQLFNRHVKDIRTLTEIIKKHQGMMTVQAQTPFTSIAIRNGDTILADLAAAGNEIALHFHEDAHLGSNPDALPATTWCDVMKEEISLIKQASGVDDVRYWSGGNLYPNLLDAAECAGLDINSDWKNPEEQKTVDALIGVSPWRPAGGSNGNDVSSFATHDPDGPVVFLPEGDYNRNDFASMRRSEATGGDEAYFQFLKESLMNSLASSEAGKVNVFHFGVHPGEFRGDPQHPFEVIDRFLTEVVDPLVASGQVRWATFSQMADAFAAWEQDNPGVAPVKP